MNLGPHQLGLKEQTAYLSNNPKIKITELPVQLVTGVQWHFYFLGGALLGSHYDGVKLHCTVVYLQKL
jgi:hypothetical protein